MTTMNISLPDSLKAFVDERVQAEGPMDVAFFASLRQRVNLARQPA